MQDSEQTVERDDRLLQCLVCASTRVAVGGVRQTSDVLEQKENIETDSHLLP